MKTVNQTSKFGFVAVPMIVLLVFAAVPFGACASERVISRSQYADQLHGFWLGQCIANWTGLITEPGLDNRWTDLHII